MVKAVEKCGCYLTPTNLENGDKVCASTSIPFIQVGMSDLEYPAQHGVRERSDESRWYGQTRDDSDKGGNGVTQMKVNVTGMTKELML